MRNVLIVDEEEHLLWALEQNLFPDRDDIVITTAASGDEGLVKLKEGKYDLLISDIKMPGKVDGFQLILRAKEIAPSARVIIMTAFGNNKIRSFADKIGITHYIEKPFNTSELRDAILEILDEQEGFRGVLSDLELTDIIQMLCVAKRRALLHLKHRDIRGRIVFDSGDVIHSEFGEWEGPEAVYKMLALRGGDIFMQSDFKSDKHTVNIGWQDLLFEGVRRADEERHLMDLAEEEEEPGPTTDVGMGVSAEEVDKVIEAAAQGPVLFSDEELLEIELAGDSDLDGTPSIGGAAESAAFEDPPSGSAPAFGKDEANTGKISALTIEMDAELVAGLVEAGIDEMDAQHAAVTSAEPPAAEPEKPSEGLAERSSAKAVGEFAPQLDGFVRECPGLIQTGLITADGELLASAAPGEERFTPRALAELFGSLVVCAEHTADAFEADDSFEELQVALGKEYLLVRAHSGSGTYHFVVVDRDVSLGVPMVLMRRFEKTFSRETGAR